MLSHLNGRASKRFLPLERITIGVEAEILRIEKVSQLEQLFPQSFPPTRSTLSAELSTNSFYSFTELSTNSFYSFTELSTNSFSGAGKEISNIFEKWVCNVREVYLSSLFQQSRNDTCGKGIQREINVSKKEAERERKEEKRQGIGWWVCSGYWLRDSLRQKLPSLTHLFPPFLLRMWSVFELAKK